MTGYQNFLRLNEILTGLFRLMWLGILWIAVGIVGFVVLGVGPASRALAGYLDLWVRRGQTPPVARTFWQLARSDMRRSVLISWVLLGASAVIAVNLMSVTNWYLRAANIGAFGVLVLIGAFVYFAMAALEVTGIRDLMASAVLLGIGSLHLTIIGAAAGGAVLWLLTRFALPLLPLLGVSVPALLVAYIVRHALRDLEPAAADGHPGAPADGPAGAGIPARPTSNSCVPATMARNVSTLRRPSPAEQAPAFSKGTPA
jgi:uncharacterized membrane protein YesL